jgi:ketosteroid isomerase-like protein
MSYSHRLPDLGNSSVATATARARVKRRWEMRIVRASDRARGPANASSWKSLGVLCSDNEAVPRGNLEMARQGYEVLNRGEVDRFLTEFVHPAYEFHTGVRVPSIPTVVRGREGLRAWIEQWYQEPWEEQLQMEVERIEELDDGRVLALLTLRASGRGSGARVETEYAHIITVRDGLCVRVDGFPSWRHALSAAGLGQ